MHGSSRPQSNKSQSTPRSMPLAPIHTLVPYCPDKISQKPRRRRLNRSLRYYPSSCRRATKPSGAYSRTEYVNNVGSIPQQIIDEVFDEYISNGRKFLDKVDKPAPSLSPCTASRAKRVPNRKLGVVDRFFHSRKKWSKFNSGSKGTGRTSGASRGRSAAGAPRSP